MLGESDRVQRDRPIDGLDASAFLTDRAEKSPRRYGALFGLDDQLMSVKVDYGKVVFRYTEGIDKPAVVQPPR